MIRIIKGTYGYMDEKTGIVRPKTEKDEPFKLTPEQEERLVGLGVAEYVGKAAEAAEDVARDENEPALEDMTAKAMVMKCLMFSHGSHFQNHTDRKGVRENDTRRSN